MPVNGKPAISIIMDRVKRCRMVDGFYIATSLDKANDPIEDIGRANGWKVYRGSEDDVLSRFDDIVKKEKPDHVVRINADNFAICPEVIDHGMRELTEGGWDIVTSFINNTYPFGSGAEMSKGSVITRLAEATDGMKGKYREHVYLYAYEHPGDYRVGLLKSQRMGMAPAVLRSYFCCITGKNDYNRISRLLQSIFKRRRRQCHL
jgi:spore coat polysaccharide biosynthesis protein SpsF (cytidylyltransferase family)